MSPFSRDLIDLPASDGRPVLTIDLAAVQANWRLIRNSAHGARTAGVVKAGGYGCDAIHVARALKAAGCDLLFVASADEGRALRQDPQLDDIEVCVFYGCMKGDELDFKNNRLTPVHNSLDDYERWKPFWPGEPDPAPFALHIDTGMNRLGMSANDAATIAADPDFKSAPIVFAMSHLASANSPQSLQNDEQRKAFAAAASGLKTVHPGLPLSLANSAGVFLGADYCLDIVRPGIALYGGQPISARQLPLEPVVHLHAPILQVHHVGAGETVGYGGTHTTARKSRIATLPLGYADGILRAASNQGSGFINGVKVPMVGRISMDLTTVDITDVPEIDAQPGSYVEILGKNVTIDQLGAASGSFGYEILTGLGNRYRWRHINQPDRGPSAGR